MTQEWEEMRLESICEFSSGGTPSKKNEAYWGGDVPWVSGRDMKSTQISDTTLHITQLAVEESSSARIAPAHDLLVLVRGMGLAHGAQIAELLKPCAFNQDIRAIHPSDGIEPRYLLLALRVRINSSDHVLSNAAHGTLKINMEELRNLKVPVPSLSEQKRIVAILDEAFGAIEKARENANHNIANARELFESYLDQTFTRHRDGWAETTIGDQFTLQRGFDITKKQQNPGEVPVVSSGGVKSYHDTAMVQGPCVVLGRKGSVGSVFYVEEDCWPHDTTLWVKDFKENSELLTYYMFRGLNLKKLDSGTANPALNRNNVHPIRISWPLEVIDQSAVALRLRQVEAQTKASASIHRNKLAALDELKQSLLQKAFTGQLTSKSPELELVP